jgi:hypothetical protein
MIFLLFTVGWGFFVGCATKGFEGECRECDVGKMTTINAAWGKCLVAILIDQGNFDIYDGIFK